ncbi:hypothetical protein EDB19DRAFT_1694997 [Suillus lakei]|nr:hypothetical protein EDB19DRAFT_1694997 [Suillus lakei]
MTHCRPGKCMTPSTQLAVHLKPLIIICLVSLLWSTDGRQSTLDFLIYDILMVLQSFRRADYRLPSISVLVFTNI